MDRVAFDPGSTLALHSNAITSLAMTPNGSVVAGTYGGGVSIVDEGGDVIRTFRSPEGSDISDIVIALLVDIDGGVLVANENGIAKISDDLKTYRNTAFAEMARGTDKTVANIGTIEIQHGANNSLGWDSPLRLD